MENLLLWEKLFIARDINAVFSQKLSMGKRKENSSNIKNYCYYSRKESRRQ